MKNFSEQSGEETNWLGANAYDVTPEWVILAERCYAKLFKKPHVLAKFGKRKNINYLKLQSNSVLVVK